MARRSSIRLEDTQVPDFGDLLPQTVEPEPVLSGDGPPQYSDMSDLLGPDPQPVLSGSVPDYPNMDAADVGGDQRWAVVKLPVWSPYPRRHARAVQEKYGVIPADEIDRFEEWSGPYSSEEARAVADDMNLVNKIMER